MDAFPRAVRFVPVRFLRRRTGPAGLLAATALFPTSFLGTSAEAESNAVAVPAPSIELPANAAESSATPSGPGIQADAPQTRTTGNFYTTSSFGAYWPQPVDSTDTRLGPALPIRRQLQGNPGFAADLGLGYDFGRWRTEVSWVRRRGTLASSQWQVGSFPLPSADEHGWVISNSLFASLYLDLPVPDTRLVPYLGGGIGATVLRTSSTTLQLGPNELQGGGGRNTLLGYQAKAGLAYRSSPRTDLFAEAVLQGSPARSQGTLQRSALTSWGLRLGLRMRLGRS